MGEMSIILNMKCEREGFRTYHKLVGLHFVCLSCDILDQTYKDRARILDRIADREERVRPRAKWDDDTQRDIERYERYEREREKEEAKKKERESGA